MKLLTVTLRDLTIDDERSLQHVGIYRDLKQVMLDDAQSFRVPAGRVALPWARALFLNLTWWSAATPSDVLCERRIPADALAHAAWHHLARCAFSDGPVSADALFMGEAIASAFDLYLVGRVLPIAPESEFIESQVPALTDAALDAGMPEESVEAMLHSTVEDPDGAFEGLRALLFDACVALLPARGVDEAAAILEGFEGRPFASLLHHYELSNWILFARANCPDGLLAPDPRVRELDRALRAASSSIELLDQRWLQPRVNRS